MPASAPAPFCSAARRSLRIRVDVGAVMLADAFEEVAARARVTAALTREAPGFSPQLHRELTHFHELDDAVQYRRALVLVNPAVGEEHDDVAAGGNDDLGALGE